MRSVVATAVVALVAVTVAAALPSSLAPDDAKPAPKATMVLSDPPGARWKPAIVAAIQRHGWDHTFATLIEVVHAGVQEAGTEFAQWLVATTATRFPTYYEEIEGILATFNELGYDESYGVTLETLVAWNWMTALQHVNLTSSSTSAWARAGPIFRTLACTSLIARAPDGTILHARNDDASAHHYTTNLTVDLDVVVDKGDNNPELVAMSTAFLGWVGMYTMMRPGVASLTEDHRTESVHNSTLISKAEFMAFIESLPEAGPVAFIMRQAMVDNGQGMPVNVNRTFAGILSYLQSTPLAAPAYFALAGVKSPSNDEGAIVARSYNSSITWRLGQTTQWVPFDWALIETNWDFWEPLPYPKVDPRRTVLVDHFNAVGQAGIATVSGLLDSLSIESSHNGSVPVNGVLNEGTIFTVIMEAANSTLQAYLRDSHSCCG